MDEETLYPVCPARNVVAAFQCFLGPDSRGIDRFLGEERIHWADDALLIVQARGRWALAGVTYRLRQSGKLFCDAVADFNRALAWWWTVSAYLVCALCSSGASSTAVCARYLAYRAGIALRKLARVWLPHGKDAAAVVGRWAAHFRLLIGSRTVGGLRI
jgi:hypothetical protein